MKKIFLFGLMVLFLAAALFAGGKQEKSTESGTTESTETAAPQKKILRIADTTPDRLMPGAMTGNAMSYIGSVYDNLIAVNPDTNELEPELAASWETEDGLVWTVKLQQGVKFHDGSDFTAEDAIFTMERTQDPDLGHQSKWNFINVEEYEKVDDYTVKVHFSQPTPTFPYFLTEYNMMVVSADFDYASMGDSKPIGTGAFKISEYVPRESLRCVKNDQYWKTGYPKIDEVQIYFIPDVDRRVAMLESGQVDIVKGGVSPLVLNRLLQNPQFGIARIQSSRVFNMDMSNPPFDDVRVRQAMKYCIDPKVLAGVAFWDLKKAELWTYESPVDVSLPIYKEIPMRGRDIEKAKELLAEAGYPDGFDTVLYFATDIDSNAEMAQAIKEMAAPAGINIDLQGFSRDVYLADKCFLPGLGITAWNVRLEPSSMLSWGYRSDGSWNESGTNIPRLDEIIDALQTEVDPAKRQVLYDELQEIFYEEGAIITIAMPYSMVVNTQRVKGYEETILSVPVVEFVDIVE